MGCNVYRTAIRNLLLPAPVPEQTLHYQILAENLEGFSIELGQKTMRWPGMWRKGFGSIWPAE